MSIAKEFVKDILVAKDFDREDRLEFYCKMYEVAKRKSLRTLAVEVKRTSEIQLIRYCTMLKFEDESRLLVYFVESGKPVYFEAYEKV